MSYKWRFKLIERTIWVCEQGQTVISAASDKSSPHLVTIMWQTDSEDLIPS